MARRVAIELRQDGALTGRVIEVAEDATPEDIDRAVCARVASLAPGASIVAWAEIAPPYYCAPCGWQGPRPGDGHTCPRCHRWGTLQAQASTSYGPATESPPSTMLGRLLAKVRS